MTNLPSQTDGADSKLGSSTLLIQKRCAILRVLFGFSGLALLAWALVDPAFRDAEGVLKGGFCLPVSAAIAFLFLGWSMAKEWRVFGLWFALGLAGQAVALQMIDAGRLIHYQHFKPA